MAESIIYVPDPISKIREKCVCWQTLEKIWKNIYQTGKN